MVVVINPMFGAVVAMATRQKVGLDHVPSSTEIASRVPMFSLTGSVSRLMVLPCVQVVRWSPFDLPVLFHCMEDHAGVDLLVVEALALCSMFAFVLHVGLASGRATGAGGKTGT